MNLKLIGEKAVEGDAAAVESLVQQTVAEELPPLEVITQCLLPAMGEARCRALAPRRCEESAVHSMSRHRLGAGQSNASPSILGDAAAEPVV
jgi:hypothetical protein